MSRLLTLTAGMLFLGAIWSCHDSSPIAPAPSAAPLAAADGAEDPVLVGAGDIARCFVESDEITAALLDGIPGTVMAVGDNAYEVERTPEGLQRAYSECYEPSWGRHKARTRPTPGNHEYQAPGAPQYYAYYGDAAGPAGNGYYSYNLGAWHVISLNSNVAADAASPQMAWLRADLAATTAACMVAYWHHPVFSSGLHGNNPHMAEIWRVLDSAGVDVAVVAHDHNYERFAPQDYTGRADPAGIREFVVGTGGGDLRAFATIRANSEARISGMYGVLKLTLRATTYDWEFVPEPGASGTDRGSASCVDETTPPPPNQPPVAHAGGPYTGQEGAPIAMSGAGSSDPEGGALTHRWSFGDGTSATGQTVSKTYPNSGSFTVTLTVTDAAGATASASTTATVADVPPTATFVAPSSVPLRTTFVLSLTNGTDVSPLDRAAGFTYQFDCGQGWFGLWGSASSVTCAGVSTAGPRVVRARIREHREYKHSEYRATITIGDVAPPPPPSAGDPVLIVLDEQAIDNGVAPNAFSPADVNDDLAAVGQRTALRYFSANVGRAIRLYSGRVGNEGFFALRSVPASWSAAGPTTDGLRNYVQAGPGLGSMDPTAGWAETRLDQVPDAVPLRATGLKLLVGRAVCAVVMDNSVWPRTFQPAVMNLKGPNLGLVAFTVTALTRFAECDNASLPIVSITVMDVGQVCGGRLAPLPAAPVLTSWSSPADVAP